MSAILPQFTTINIKNYPAKLDSLLTANLKEIDVLLSQKTFTWENLFQPYEDMEDKLEKFLTVIVGHYLWLAAASRF